MPSNHRILCHPLLLLPSIFPSIRVFSNESVFLIRWPKYRNFSFTISPSNEYSGLISFRMDWLDLLAVQRTLKSLLQHHSSKAPILQLSASITVQLSHPYMTTRKTIALTRRTFVGKVISLLLNMLSRLLVLNLKAIALSESLQISCLETTNFQVKSNFKNRTIFVFMKIVLMTILSSCFVLLESKLRWTLGYMCLFQFWFPRCVCPEVGLLGHKVVLFAIF